MLATYYCFYYTLVYRCYTEKHIARKVKLDAIIVNNENVQA